MSALSGAWIDVRNRVVTGLFAFGQESAKADIRSLRNAEIIHAAAFELLVALRHLPPHCQPVEITFRQQPVLLLRDEQLAGFGVGLLNPEGNAPQFLIARHQLLLQLRAAIARGLSLSFRTEHLFGAGLLVIGHIGNVINPFASAVSVALDQAATSPGW